VPQTDERRERKSLGRKTAVKIPEAVSQLWRKCSRVAQGSRSEGHGVDGGGSNGAEVGRRVLHEVLLQLGDDVLAVSVLAQRAQVRPDLVHQGLALASLGHVDHLLHHVVGVLVLHHCLQSVAAARDKKTRSVIKITIFKQYLNRGNKSGTSRDIWLRSKGRRACAMSLI